MNQSVPHFDAYAALLADARFVERVEIDPRSRHDAHRAFCALLGHWQLHGRDSFIVEERATDDLVGRVGIDDWEGWPEPELGWWVIPAAWGRGYVVESANARAIASEVGGIVRRSPKGAGAPAPKRWPCAPAC